MGFSGLPEKAASAAFFSSWESARGVKPKKEVKFNEKLLWTFGCLIIYFIMSSVPIYGRVLGNETSDPFEFLRTIMASNRGTLAELGIGPIVTAGLILQILVGSKIINIDMGDPEERGPTESHRVLPGGEAGYPAPVPGPPAL